MADLTNPNYSSNDAAYFGNARNTVNIDSKDIGIAAANTALDSKIKAFRVRKGFCVTGAILKSTDIDTNGSPAVLLDLGDLDDDDRFIAASNIGQAGGQTATLAAAGIGYIFTADTDVYIKMSTAAATGAAGTVRAVLTGYMTEV